MSDAIPWIELRRTRTPLSNLDGVDKSTLTANERKAVEFCIQWLNDKSTFEITTSGSTGLPKPITIRRQAMIASAEATANALGLLPGMTSLVCLDTSFIAGMMMLVRCLNTGMNMIVEEPSANPLKGLGDTEVDFAALVPYQVVTILQSPERSRLAAIGTIILGGAAVSPELRQQVSDLPGGCYATFGMTETLSHIALQKLNGLSKQETFHTLDGIKISVDARGCLVIDANYLDEVVVTNDLVELVNAKEFKWLGRYDNIINSGGVKVIPEKIEGVVANWMAARRYSNRFFVAGVGHSQLGEQVVLFMEGTLPKEDEHALLNSLRTALGKYELPGRVFYKEHFVETKSGKIDRRASSV
jgi:O-succinylbenzoic acid--CoA ligase